MYTICINGAPGSGKTTLANELFKNDNSEIVHLDNLLNNLKRALPEKSVDMIYREEEVYPQLSRTSLIYWLIHLRYVNELYKTIKKAYIKRELKRLEESAILTGKKYFIVEGVGADQYNDFLNFDFKIFIKSKTSERIARIEKRDHNATGPLDYNLYKDLESINYDFYDIIINNYGTLAEFVELIKDLNKIIKNSQNIKRSLEKAKND